jgi:type I restriction-modification system DNA methylase subunit
MVNYKDVIESRYNRRNWQLLLHDIFGNKVDFWENPYEITTNSQLSKQTLWLGTITLSDGETISVYEVELTDNVDIERNRRGIRDMLLTDWRNNGNAGAFMFCYRKNESVLRFSYVSEAWTFADDGSYQKESTDAKRFTYLLGEGHRSRTAIQQFEKLRDSNLSLKDLTKAFSVDAVSDMFFDGYKRQYEDIIQYITGKRMVKVANKWEEQIKNDPCEEIMQEFAHFQNPEKAVRDYVKKLMGRLVFLQFLQKKGWLGVPVGEPWGKGDTEFIQTLFAQCQDKDHFVDNILEVLFNDLNTERDNDLSTFNGQCSMANVQCKIPYLNGGLFERDATDETEFPLPAKYMQSLLDFFASYNFTIDENDPDDAEVGVDPEMLGRIFENLLEDNKDKGAFYTPKEIVSYMCRESLIAYLQTDIEDETTKDAIRQFVTTHDVAALGTNDRSAEGRLQGKKFRQQVDEALCNVKICDPAIGSGAFPMGLLKELFQCRTTLEGIEQNKAAEIKKHIIQQNIYGVDIEKGAVDIARLRFWLSLIVDEETPQALPNLDFKIMQGNSLLEQYKGVDLSTITELKTEKHGTYQTTMFDDMIDVLRLDLRKMLEEYYDCTDHHKKQILRSKIIDNVKQQLREQSINVDFDDLDLSGNNQFMLWHTWFYDVFSQGGFDVVIANPPYVDAKKLKAIAPNLKQFKVFSGTADLYTYFYEMALSMLIPKGIMTFITSNKWIRSEYGRKLRKLFLDNEILQLIDFGRNRLFGATVDSNIISVKKEPKELQPSLYYFDENTEGSSLMEMLKYGEVKNVHLSEDTWLLKAGENDKMKSKIESHGIPLKDFGVNIFRGILTGFNKAFHIDEIEKERLINLDAKNSSIIKPLMCGGDTEKFYCKPPQLWIINIHNGIKGGDIKPIDINNFPIIKRRLDTYYDVLSNRNDKGSTPYNLRNCAYLREFEREKIIWQAISKRIAFSYDPQGKYYCDVTTYFMTGNNLKYILAILNSKLFEYALLKIYLEGDTFKSKNAIIQNFPVPPTSKTTDRLVDIVDSIISTKQTNLSANTSALESEIDRLVYQLYDLTYDEVLIVDPDTPITREDYEKE